MKAKVQQAKEVYQRIKSKLKGQEGKIVAIDMETGDYFLGTNTLEAYEKGRQKYPQAEFFFMRVGPRTAFMVGMGK